MSVDIHPHCRDRLAERLTAVFPRITVNHGKFLDYGSTAVLAELDATLPEKGKLREVLSGFIGESPFSDFVRGAIQIEIYRNEPYTKAKNPTPLSEMAAYRDVAATAGRLVTDFLSLPWKYTLTIALPHDIGTFFSRILPTFAISTGIRIVTPDEQFMAEYPAPPSQGSLNFSRLSTLASMLSGGPEWDRDRAYLQIQVDGFIPLFERTAPLESGIGHIKSFCGLGMAHSLFAVNQRFGEPPAKEDLWIHRRIADKWEFENSTDLDRSVSSVLYHLTINEALDELGSDEQRRAFTKKALESILAVFSAGPLSARILLASQWHFDSFGDSDQMLSFVQAAIVLEILLGDKAASDVIGLSELLRNRCAYLISRSQGERELILAEFKKIYDVRSNIVHAGKKRLNTAESKLFFGLRWICQRVIQEETKLLSWKRR